MSFGLVKIATEIIDFRSCYKKIAEDFCKYYYSIFDTNLFPPSHLYYEDSQFTYQEEEFLGINKFMRKLKEDKIYRFSHYNLRVTTQPLGPKFLIISILGDLSINDSIFRNKFSEILVLHCNENNKIGIFSTILRIMY